MDPRPSPDAPIRHDISEALHRAFPQGVMALVMDIQESHLAAVFPPLKARLLEIPGTEVLHERDPQGGSGWSAGEGRLPPAAPGEPLRRDDRPSSYYLFFLAPTDPMFRFAEDGPIAAEFLAVGFTVALSVVAPLAMILLNYSERDEIVEADPDIMVEAVEDADGNMVEFGDFCRRHLPADGLAALEGLRRDIRVILEAAGYRVVPDEELGKNVPWLTLPPVALSHVRTLTVRDALFFWGM